MAYNPNILREVLRARSLTREQLSKRLGLSVTQLESELQREPEPRQGILNDIAKELALPPFIFFMERAPQFHDVLPDFRSPNPAPRAKSRETIEAIHFAEGIQRTVIEGRVRGAPQLPAFTATNNDDVDEFALAARRFFNITIEDQSNAKDAREFYNVCRNRIEEKGIFVLHDSFPHADGSGFCLAHFLYPVVVINTMQQTRGRRLFTLIQELAHVLMGKSGISDPFVRENVTERLCNRFAGAFLVPRSYVAPLLGTSSPANDPDQDDVRWASRRLKISQEATVLRLEQLSFYRSGSYDKWKRLVHNANPDYSEKKGGPPQPPAQEKVKLAKYGYQFARAFDALLSDGRISEVNLYRSTGLKPKYQRPYFAYAKSISDAELRELQDE
ncbi:XRE family transcriptional regulator [Bradyrhizobium barranii subsp. apii]|uniref:XRE family transcriptional regulator n=1 Tax=Bradyrhizobium barranii subsp. apii TaxID=2819348 RepID=A0A8T5V6H9_9BRAD|nr:XRE family transcriptional regulator [Bradyrhizobium barranii]UPT84278.1 XRE family transcriptional regulator [Bradyrhizobium barranii subsp. apii]